MGFAPNVDVVIVGAGPAGLTAACILQQRGVHALVVDSAAEGANTSRAAVIHARTLEVLETIDITHRVLEEGIVVPTFTVRDRSRTLATLEFSGLKTAYPFTLMLPQSRTEQILAARLLELGGDVHRRQTVTAVSQTHEAASVIMRSETGVEQQVDTRFVIGADGMHSVVRECAGIDFRGDAYEQSFLLADVRMSWPLSEHEVQLFLAPDGLAVVAPLPGGHHRLVATADKAPEHPNSTEVQAILDARGPGDTRVTEVVWGSRFRVQHRVASAYRSGHLLLAGDAAHVHSPAGGQGMNTGIQDAVDLAGTLADVLAEAQLPSALDDYERRRRPVAQGVVSFTDRMTRAATLKRPVARRVRNLAIGAALGVRPVRNAMTRRVAELK